MKKYAFPIYALSFASILVNLTAGYSAFIYGFNSTLTSKLPTTSKRKVCYLKAENKTTYYTSIDSALTAAYGNEKNDQIFVIPNLGSDLEINDEHTLEKGDTLTFPYEGETYNIGEDDGNSYSYNFADTDTSKKKVSVILKNQLTIASGATFNIGGQTGSTQGAMGAPSGMYTELAMDSKASLTVNGTIYCYGFIKDKGDHSITFKNGSNLRVPVVFYSDSGLDYSQLIGSVSKKEVFPFNQFDVATIRPTMIFEYGSTMKGMAHLIALGQGTRPTANLIGKSSSFLTMSSGSKIVWKYTDSSKDVTTNTMNAHKSAIDIYGNVALGSLSVTVANQTINSADFYLPIPYGYDVRVKEGANFTVPNDIKGAKFMPGSSLVAEKNSTLTANTGILFYQSNNCNGYTVEYPTSEAARFVNSGIVNINAGFEGVIETNNDDSGTLHFGENYSGISDNKEGTASLFGSNTVFSWGGAKGKIALSGATNPKQESFVARHSYKSENDFWADQNADTFEMSAKINYDNDTAGK